MFHIWCYCFRSLVTKHFGCKYALSFESEVLCVCYWIIIHFDNADITIDSKVLVFYTKEYCNFGIKFCNFKVFTTCLIYQFY